MSDFKTDREILFRCILENPADDALRLAYADEMELTDPDRAGWLRDQVRHGWRVTVRRAMPIAWDGQSFGGPVDRRVWTLECPSWAEWCVWERGYISEFGCTMGAWTDAATQHAKLYLQLHPVERVVITDRVPEYSYWWRESPLRDVSSLPDAIFDLIVSEAPRTAFHHGNIERAIFDSDGDARSALSQAALAWGLREAGITRATA